MSQDYDVFISYNRADRDRVRLLKEEIRRLGLSVWMDEQIEPATEFQRDIEQALHNSGCVLVAWTEGSVASDWVRAEATSDSSRRVKLLNSGVFAKSSIFVSESMARVLYQSGVGADQCRSTYIGRTS